VRIDRTIFAGLDTLRVAAPNPAAGGRPGDRRSRARGGGVELADFRPYTPGDDLRLVDWNIYARLEAVLVRLFHEDRDLSVVIIVDASASMGFGTPRKIDHAGELAVCLAFLALHARDRVRVVVAGRRVGGNVKGERVTALPMIMQMLERIEPDGQADLAAALAAEVDRGRADHVILLTDLLVEPDVREATLRRLASAGTRAILLHTLGEGELSPDLDDGAVMVDAETGEEVPVKGGKAATKKYLDGLAAWRGEIETRCASLGIVYAPAFTTAPARQLIADDLRRRRITEAGRGGGR
jgi:uncharacterized protein (DUF58 family)